MPTCGVLWDSIPGESKVPLTVFLEKNLLDNGTQTIKDDLKKQCDIRPGQYLDVSPLWKTSMEARQGNSENLLDKADVLLPKATWIYLWNLQESSQLVQWFALYYIKFLQRKQELC